jgi:hypothetical protein
MAHPDLEELLNALIPFAQEMLAKHGEFYPFGAAIDANGQVVAQAAEPGEENPDSQEVIKMLVAGMRDQAKRGEIRAAGICYDARVVPPGKTEKTDAIACRLEHESGEALVTFVPYRKGFLGRYKYDELFASEGDQAIFVGASGAASE